MNISTGGDPRRDPIIRPQPLIPNFSLSAILMLGGGGGEETLIPPVSLGGREAIASSWRSPWRWQRPDLKPSAINRWIVKRRSLSMKLHTIKPGDAVAAAAWGQSPTGGAMP